MTRISLMAFVIVSCLPVFPQNEMKEINEIKSNPRFLYATGTSLRSAEDATNNAKDLIALEIEQWLKENSSEDVAGYVAKSKENLSQIKTKRGNLFRVFVYVKKADVLPFYKEEDVMVVGYIESNIANESNTNNQQSEITDNIANYTPSNLEKKLLELNTFTQLNDYINQGRKKQDIIKVGNYKNISDVNICYVFIHNREGNIPACLKKENIKYINIGTGKDDAITNYKGCGAIWIEIKSE